MPEKATTKRPPRKPKVSEDVIDHKLAMVASLLAAAALAFAAKHWDEFFVELELNEIEHLESDTLRDFFVEGVVEPSNDAVQLMRLLDATGHLK